MSTWSARRGRCVLQGIQVNWMIQLQKQFTNVSVRNNNALGTGQSVPHVVSATGSLGGSSAVEMAERQGQDEPGQMSLLSLLRTLLADAQLNDQQSIVANVRECIRIVSFFDSRG